MTDAMRRAGFAAVLAVIAVLAAACAARGGRAGGARPPNIVVILCDDLGYAELGCYGQERIRTPNIDALAAAGVRFTAAYSGSPVCAPSRCALLTGRDMAHAAIRDNKELQPEGQQPLPEGTETIASMLKTRGYATAAIGKWGLGPPGSGGEPGKHGFDLFYGYLCQRHAHGHYPAYLYRNATREPVAGNAPKYTRADEPGGAYAPDLFRAEAERFISANADRPFFLYFATTVPHLAMQVPEDSLAEYRGTLPEKPYDGGKGYLPHAAPHAAYAAMVTRMDRDVGSILALLRELKLDENTIVVFTSDNGPTIDVGGADSDFFESSGPFRGRKMQLYEGGIRVPLIVRWPGAAAAVCDYPVASWDLLATLGAAAGVGAESMPATDGSDIAPFITGRGNAPRREHLYWEFPSGGGWQAVRIAGYKGVRRNAKKPGAGIELYDLGADPGESRDIAAEHPDVVQRMAEIMSARAPSPIAEWNY